MTFGSCTRQIKSNVVTSVIDTFSNQVIEEADKNYLNILGKDKNKIDKERILAV